MTAPLYNTEILRLAATIPHHERLTDPDGTAERRSPICGSRVTVDVNLGADGEEDEHVERGQGQSSNTLRPE